MRDVILRKLPRQRGVPERRYVCHRASGACGGVAAAPRHEASFLQWIELHVDDAIVPRAPGERPQLAGGRGAIVAPAGMMASVTGADQVRLRAGNTLAIEPMLLAGGSRYRTKKDG